MFLRVCVERNRRTWNTFSVDGSFYDVAMNCTAQHTTHTGTFINQCNAMQWLRPYSVAGILPDSPYWVICESCESLRKWKEYKKFVKWTGNICVSNLPLAQTHTHVHRLGFVHRILQHPCADVCGYKQDSDTDTHHRRWNCCATLCVCSITTPNDCTR